MMCEAEATKKKLGDHCGIEMAVYPAIVGTGLI
jgi:hypothetical protein